MHLFGLTGNLASGKSSVAAQFRRRGLPVLDADDVARDIVRPGSPGFDEVVRAFGTSVVTSDGVLDRRTIATMIFADKEKREILNAITHPKIAAETMRRKGELERLGEPLACYEATLLVERGIHEAFRPLVVVTAPPPLQVARACARNELTEIEARSRMAAQMPSEEKARIADYVISNDGTLAELERKADEVLLSICRRLHVDPSPYFVGVLPGGVT